MKIHEYQGADLFRQYNIPTPKGAIVDSADAAIQLANEYGYPVVLKSQVLIGGRGKAGGIKVVRSDEDVRSAFAVLENLTIKGYPVRKIYLVQGVDIQQEFYLSVTVDSAQGDAVVIFSKAGGVDIEEVAKTDPDKIKKYHLNGTRELGEDFRSKVLVDEFQSEEDQKAVMDICQKLIQLFFEKDCSLAEINPLVVDGEGNILAADSKVNFDDNALYRQEDVVQLRDMDYEDEDELEAKESGLSFVKLDGNVGCIVNGAGLAMGTMDVVKLCGGEPANFLDVGGSSNPQKVLTALKIILRNPNVKAILINIFGGITRCDDIANGLLQALDQLNLKVPFVIRLTGTNEEEAKEILKAKNIETYSTMREAVEKVVELAKT